MHAPEPPAFPPVAARHGKAGVPQAASEPGLDNLIQLAGYKGDNLNAVAGDHPMQRPGYGTADQSIYTKVHQPERFLDGEICRQSFLVPAQNLPGLCTDNVNLPRNVENRRNSFVPVCKGRYDSQVRAIAHTTGGAIGVPNASRTLI
jgi:hypothetical protein